MISKVASEQVPRDLLLLADPEWSLVEQYLADADCYGYQQDEQLVGVVVLIWLAEGVREIKNIAVDPAYQHRGIAKALLATAIQQCQQDPACHEVQIGTGNSSLRQLSIYQHAGFELFDVWVDFFVDNYPEPIFEDGLQCKSMVRLRMTTDTDKEETTNVANG
ncbi:GNAT family N-acetyltransferase [Lactiplantibacillus herbarum]|uniref:GNAT family N-acetyltransferase n=1 Tax=Lactiplantibacillus herbarum TaxID=1670446 RepID=UPI00064E5A85|nr:GNAT family N-acetyltransferase [Lactiplantibacillus herbarum]